MSKFKFSPEERAAKVAEIDTLRETMTMKAACDQAGVSTFSYDTWKNGRAQKKTEKIRRVDLADVVQPSPLSNTPIIVTVLQGTPQAIGETLKSILQGR